MRETVYNLSFLRDDILLVAENALLLTVAQLNEGLKSVEGLDVKDEWYSQDELRQLKWYIARKDTWSIDAERMIKRELEDSTNTETAPGWFERALNALDDVDFKSIEKTIMEVLSKTKGVTEFYQKAERVDVQS